MNIFTFIKISIAVSACGIFILSNTEVFKKSKEDSLTKSFPMEKKPKYIASKNSYF